MIHQKGILEEIIIFTRYPLAGKAKTRLIPKLGAEGAASLQRTMTEQVVYTAREVVKSRKPNLAIYYTDGSQQQMQEWLGTDSSYFAQKGINLGQRLHNGFLDSWKRGAQRTVIIGSDCPALESQLISKALSALDRNQLVLGPSGDGGYYLIGTTCDLPTDTLTHLFTGIPWGTSDVLQATVNKGRQKGIEIATLKELQDIDIPIDLTYFDHHSNPQ